MAPHYYSLQVELCFPLTESKHWNSPYSPIYLMFDQLRIIQPTFLASQPLNRDSLGCHVAMPQSLLSILIIPYIVKQIERGRGEISYIHHMCTPTPKRTQTRERERERPMISACSWMNRGFFARPPHASIVSICKGRIKNRERKKKGGRGSKKCKKNNTFEKHSPVILASNIFWRHYFLFIGKLGI